MNNKHTVFGCVVGGMETIDKMENIPTGEEDKPLVCSIIRNWNSFLMFKLERN